jgi:EAL domain-containing protein (putative c-di-GMP-specific phosphodiesterase class I)/GGDEF domain-containing protein
MNEREDRRLQEAILAWEQRRTWLAFVAVSALLTFVYPLANFVGAPPGTEPLRLRLVIAAIAVSLCVPPILFPRLRRYARLGLLVETVAFYVVQGIFLAQSQFSPYVVVRAVLVISVVPLVAPTIFDVVLAVGTFMFTTLVTTIAQGGSVMQEFRGPLGTVFLACIIAVAVGTVTIASRRREIRARLAAELSQEEQLAVLRTRDRVTGLPNFERFMDLCEDAIASAYIRGCRFGITEVALERLAEVDRQYGALIGNSIVIQAARRFEATAKNAITCRIRSDRFVTLAIDIDSGQAEELAYALLESLAEPFRVDGKSIYVTGTAGTAIYPDDGTTVEALLARCDDNVRRARGGEHDVSALVSGEPDAHLVRMRDLREDVHSALVNGQFRLLYQPCVDSHTWRVVSAEALLRWEHPKYGLVSPAEFIPLLESDGVIATVGEWVLREATHACARWRETREIGVSVNVSLQQFRDAALCERVRNALDDAHLPTSALTLELTETVAMQNIDYTLRTMRTCRASGVKFALDDFGTGYSSMAYLQQLPIDEIKIDGSFVEGLPGNENDAAIVRAIISLARSLNCIVYAEGVERADQAQWLVKEDCNVLQGMVVSAPIAGPEFEACLAKRETQHDVRF